MKLKATVTQYRSRNGFTALQNDLQRESDHLDIADITKVSSDQTNHPNFDNLYDIEINVVYESNLDTTTPEYDLRSSLNNLSSVKGDVEVEEI